MSDWESYLQTHQDDYLKELNEFLSIPSISSLPEHEKDIRKAADWVAARLTAAGMEEARVMETGGHPVVYAQWLHQPDKPTIMVYGHYDVQPVDPLDLWDAPPFEPVIKDDRIYARGASDDKGNMFIPIIVAEAILKCDGSLPLNLKFFLEGTEEIGSPPIPKFVAEHKDLFACDMILNADGGQWSETQPVLMTGLRGLCELEMTVKGPSADLHSGSDGGAVNNPIHALARIISSMRDDDGHIVVDGFYDGVREITDADRAAMSEIPFDEQDYMQRLGVKELFGEPGFTTLERRWMRPTLDVNGMYGGFQGEGVKTIIPSHATAKITCRLVPDQDPDVIRKHLLDHIKSHTPPGVEVAIKPLSPGVKPYEAPLEHPGHQAAAEVLTEVYGRRPFQAKTGGSVPITTVFKDVLDTYSICFAFGLDDENIHAPNEFFRLQSFKHGQKAFGKIFYRLGA